MPPTHGSESTEAETVAINAAVKQTNEKTAATPLGAFPSIEAFIESGFREIVQASKCVNAFPQNTARDLYCSYPTFGKVIDAQTHRVLGLVSTVLKWQNVKGNIQRRQEDEQFEMLLECNDAIMERLGSNLDELAGARRNTQPLMLDARHTPSAQNALPSTTSTGKGAGSWNLRKHEKQFNATRLITSKNIVRPQLNFNVAVDNSSDTPFVPKLTEKPNSLKPLAILPEYDDDGEIVSYLHPYEFELMRFNVPEEQLQHKEMQEPQALAATELVYVDTVTKLNAALEELREHKEIAVDVEHHSYRTFLGLTCLVQISTRSKDYIFDALELRDNMHVLNAVFTDPKVVKIFHGADSDIIWLQRDLALYVVNMFDTHQAARALSFARLSLAYVLQHYCHFEPDKTFQLADWRVRPLPEELIAYARQDTHFLIYVFERMTNDLLAAGNQQDALLRSVYQHSTEICTRRFVKPILGPDSYMDVFRKSKRIFDNRQLYALQQIFQWRDCVARGEDESYGYALPNHMMLKIAESLPREMQGILACCNPIPPLVRQYQHALHQIVLRAREQPLEKPILETTDHIDRGAVIANTKDYDSKLHCLHDLTHNVEFRDDLPTLLAKIDVAQAAFTQSQTDTDMTMTDPELSLFSPSEYAGEVDLIEKHATLMSNVKFISPYSRYLAIQPLAEKEQRAEEARIAAERSKRKLCPDTPPVAVVCKTADSIKTEAAAETRDLSIKQYLKRKHEEAVANKAAAAAAAAANAAAAATEVSCTATTGDGAKAQAMKRKRSDANQLKFVDKLATTKAPSLPTTTAVCKPEAEDVESDGAPDEMPSTSEQALIYQQQQLQLQQKRSKGKYGQRQQRKDKFRAKSAQSSDRPVAQQQQQSHQQQQYVKHQEQQPLANFDYQKVDFKRFQGGAKRAVGAELKAQFHGKGNTNKATNKKFNKLFTFSNVKSTKK